MLEPQQGYLGQATLTGAWQPWQALLQSPSNRTSPLESHDAMLEVMVLRESDALPSYKSFVPRSGWDGVYGTGLVVEIIVPSKRNGGNGESKHLRISFERLER